MFAKQIRPELLVLFAGMIGAPAFIRKDEKRNDERDQSPSSSGESSPGSSP